MRRSLIQQLACIVFILIAVSAHAQTRDTSILQKKNLKEVTVTAIKPFIAQKGGRITLNVAESSIAAGSNAYEVVLRIPGVTDQNGSLQTGGKNITILVDGRYTNLNGEDLKNMLFAMPANGIDKIELITNPPAKYDARGGAVLNIITTKNKKFGTNGTIIAGLASGHYLGYNSGISLNYRNKKINVYGSYDNLHSRRYSDIQSNRIIETNENIIEHTHEINMRNNHSFKGGLDYTINNKNAFGLLVNGMLNYRNENTETNSLNDRPGSLYDSLATVAITGNARFAIPSVSAWYKWQIDTTGRELNIQADYFSYQKKWNEHFVTRFFNSNQQEYALPWLLRDQSPGNNIVQSLSVDYIHPARIARIETGVKTTFTTTDNNISWERLYDREWKTDSGKTNHFIYHENINAFYVNIIRSIKKLDVQLGLRAEETNTKGISRTLNQVNEQNYINFFPNLSISYNQSGIQQFGFSYRKSIQRFNFDVVNPFIIYKSRYSYYQGNPAIKPSIAHNFEFTHSYKDEWFTTLGYSRYVNTLAEVYKKDSITSAVINTSENLGTADYFSGSITLSKNLFRGKWSATNTMGAFYARYNAALAGYNNAAITAYFSSENLVQLARGWRGELNASYYSPAVIGATKFKSSWSVNVGLSKNVLKNNGTVTCNVTDVFNTMMYRYNITAAGVLSSNTSKTESRLVKLVFTYRFGNKQLKKTMNHKTGIENERKRMSNGQ